MKFIDHTVNWFKGESFEGGMLILWGAMLVIMAVYFWKFGQSATTRVMIVPLLIVGLFWSIVPGVGLIRNKYRVEKFRIEYQMEPTAFVEKEKKRVESFIDWYRYLLAGWSILIIIGLVIFTFWGGNFGRAIGIAMILFAISGLLVDHTSEHNARAYKSEIDKTMKSINSDKNSLNQSLQRTP